jgi:hypothetical protein
MLRRWAKIEFKSLYLLQNNYRLNQMKPYYDTIAQNPKIRPKLLK